MRRAARALAVLTARRRCPWLPSWRVDGGSLVRLEFSIEKRGELGERGGGEGRCGGGDAECVHDPRQALARRQLADFFDRLKCFINVAQLAAQIEVQGALQEAVHRGGAADDGGGGAVAVRGEPQRARHLREDGVRGEVDGGCVRNRSTAALRVGGRCCVGCGICSDDGGGGRGNG